MVELKGIEFVETHRGFNSAPVRVKMVGYGISD
jgi:hypothetical protein